MHRFENCVHSSLLISNFSKYNNPHLSIAKSYDEANEKIPIQCFRKPRRTPDEQKIKTAGKADDLDSINQPAGQPN